MAREAMDYATRRKIRLWYGSVLEGKRRAERLARDYGGKLDAERCVKEIEAAELRGMLKGIRETVSALYGHGERNRLIHEVMKEGKR